MVPFLMTLSDPWAIFQGFNDRHSRAASLRQLSFLSSKVLTRVGKSSLNFPHACRYEFTLSRILSVQKNNRHIIICGTRIFFLCLIRRHEYLTVTCPLHRRVHYTTLQLLEQATNIHCVSKNEPTLASCIFIKYRLILIIWVNSISTLSKIIRIFNFLFHFCLLYLRLHDA